MSFSESVSLLPVFTCKHGNWTTLNDESIATHVHSMNLELPKDLNFQHLSSH